MFKWLLVIILILIIIGLWFNPQITKTLITGATASVKSFIASVV